MYDNLVGKSFEYNGNVITLTKKIEPEGRNSVVFECNYLDEDYVIKYFKGDRLNRYKRFISEVKKIKIINQNIENCTPYIIEAYLPRCNMRETKNVNIKTSPFYIMKKGECFEYKILSFEEKLDKIIELSIRLKQMHDFDYIHRDIKPANLVYYNGTVTLIDYGTSSVPGIETIDGEEIMGSIDTMAPEMLHRIHNQAENDYKYADIYSLGKTIWIILTNDTKARKFTTYDHNTINSKISLDDIDEGIIMELEQIITEATKANYLERISLDDLISRFIFIKEKLINNPDNSNINKFKCMLNRFSNLKYDSINISDSTKILKFVSELNLIGVKISLIDTGSYLCDSLEDSHFIISYDAKIKMYYFKLNNTRFIFDINNININDKNIIIKTNELKDITDDNYTRLKDVDSFSRMSILTNKIGIETSKIYIECDICLESIEIR